MTQRNKWMILAAAAAAIVATVAMAQPSGQSVDAGKKAGTQDDNRSEEQKRADRRAANEKLAAERARARQDGQGQHEEEEEAKRKP
ncbi:MAG: hypothetical protein QM599_02005 [Pseudoxanthomonas sp.]